MKTLSEALLDLAARVSDLEASAKAATEENRDSLEDRRRAVQQAIDVEATEFTNAAKEAETRIRQWWIEARGSVERQVSTMRKDLSRWQAERSAESAERVADLAEAEAQAAIELAKYWLNAAEYAAVDAALARADAKTLADEEA